MRLLAQIHDHPEEPQRENVCARMLTYSLLAVHSFKLTAGQISPPSNSLTNNRRKKRSVFLQDLDRINIL
ncbi:hypothetical protein MHYP_G00245750 [Metynnis hypsauchen]